MTREKSIPERGGSIARVLCRESPLHETRDADDVPNLRFGVAVSRKDHTYIWRSRYNDTTEFRPAHAGVAPCDRKSQRIDGRPRPRSGRRTGVAPLGRRCWARARKPEQPSRRRTAMPRMAEPIV